MISILLIDQESLYQKTFAKIIEANPDCQLVGVAENGYEASQQIEKYHPQIVISEVLLGNENGIDVCNGLKTQYPELKTYILSSYGNLSLIKNSIRAGMDRYLFKPLSKTDLAMIIDENLEVKEQEDNEHYRALVQAVEKKDYKMAYDISKEYISHVFTDVEPSYRKDVLKNAATNLIYMIPGMDQTQKEYYLQKYELNNKTLMKEMLCYCWLISVITEIFRQLCVMKYAHMNKVLQYIENNKNNEISLTELSEQAEISSGYLSRIFRKYYNISVVDYIHLRKIVNAKYYMASSEMNISDISFLLGYSEAGYFCKIFKKYEGITPSNFHTKYIKKA